MDRTGQHRTEFSRPVLLCYGIFLLHRLTDDCAGGVCCVLLHLGGGVGVGVEREPCGVVTQGSGEGFRIHTVLEGQGGKKIGKNFIRAAADAGAGVLGAMLIDEEAIGPMLMAVSAEDFQRPENRNIFRAFRELYGQGKACDPILVNEHLGGSYNQYLATLIELTPTSANADAYARG